AADDGTIRDQFALPYLFIASYTATATGPLSGAVTTSFTDGNVKLYIDSARTIERTVFERGGGTADSTVYVRASALTGTSSYKIEVLDKTGGSKALSSCVVGTTDPQDFSYAIQSGDSLSDSSEWKVVVHEYKKSSGGGGGTPNTTCSTSAPFDPAPSDNLFQKFDVAQAFAFANSTDAGNCTSYPCANTKSSFKSGDTAFVRV